MNKIEKIKQIDDKLNMYSDKYNKLFRVRKRIELPYFLLYLSISLASILSLYFNFFYDLRSFYADSIMNGLVFALFASFSALLFTFLFTPIHIYISKKNESLKKINKLIDEIKKPQDELIQKRSEIVNELDKDDIIYLEDADSIDSEVIDKILDKNSPQFDIDILNIVMKSFEELEKDGDIKERAGRRKLLRHIEKKIEYNKNKTRNERFNKIKNENEIDLNIEND